MASDPKYAKQIADLLMQDSRLEKLKIAYANAMWAWAHIESDLFGVYIAATNGFNGQFNVSREAYFSIVATSARLDMTHVAAKARWQKLPVIKIWLELESECRAQLSKRGKMAHLTGSIIEPDKPHQKPLAIIGEHFWHPKRPNTYQEAKNKGYTAEQLDEMAKQWELLHFKMFEFYSPFWSLQIEAQKTTFPSPTGGLGLLGGLLTQVHEESQKQP